MRILVVSPDLYERHRGLLTQMHRLRAQVSGPAWVGTWRSRPTRNATSTTGSGQPTSWRSTRLTGCRCVRLLPAIGPTMLRQTFP